MSSLAVHVLLNNLQERTADVFIAQCKEILAQPTETSKKRMQRTYSLNVTSKETVSPIFSLPDVNIATLMAPCAMLHSHSMGTLQYLLKYLIAGKPGFFRKNRGVRLLQL